MLQRMRKGFSSLATTLAPVLVAGCVLVWPDEARAGSKLALDLDFAHGIDETGIKAGTGGVLRFGQELDLVGVSLTPELGISYHTFSGALDASHYSAMVGARFGFGAALRPSVFGHVGIGRLDLEVGGDTGATFDVGIALDLVVLPILDIGIHGAYDVLLTEGDGNFDWLRAGAHVALGF
ncbi:MAG TPA: hypothetical protein VKY73_17950 [Polyangiaceae bacterium]|nr:hypothetical protein [Polyangiaceae bacterium]